MIKLLILLSFLLSLPVYAAEVEMPVTVKLITLDEFQAQAEVLAEVEPEAGQEIVEQYVDENGNEVIVEVVNYE